jgi:curved DNA-binding protein CbpA
MSNFDSNKDYYKILGANERTTPRDLERLYKRMAARRHPDRGGSEEEMKSLNEAYSILRDKETKDEYDAQRAQPSARFVPVTTPTASDVGLLGQGLSAFFILLIGLFLLFLVRLQWIRFLWPLALLAGALIMFGVLMARSAMRAMNASLPLSNPFRRYKRLQEAVFWSVVIAGVYGIYLLLTAI